VNWRVGPPQARAAVGIATRRWQSCGVTRGKALGGPTQPQVFGSAFGAFGSLAGFAGPVTGGV
jgi:hypothetical protein